MNSPEPEGNRGRPSPAMIVALLALFVALGGSSYAALKLNGRNITNRSVAGKKLKKNTLSSKEVKNGSLLKSDFKPGQLPAGITSVVMRKSAPANVGANSFSTASVNCLPGEVATGGGAFNEDQVLSMNVTSSYPLPNPGTSPATGDGIPATGWKVWMGNTAVAPNTFQAYVMCASP